MQFLSKERISLAPDCGFAPGFPSTIPLDEAYVKLKNEVKAAQILGIQSDGCGGAACGRS